MLRGDTVSTPELARYELSVVVGPCSEEACEDLMAAILDLPEAQVVSAGAVESTRLDETVEVGR